ncbi:unnamed protein product [Orchesella dallaii]|uniref:Uncharacterized protein n=1 Tax=Orchesella dallaii TaxID=48710 RepID=A0ABP1QQX2_9HEXA
MSGILIRGKLLSYYKRPSTLGGQGTSLSPTTRYCARPDHSLLHPWGYSERDDDPNDGADTEDNPNDPERDLKYMFMNTGSNSKSEESIDISSKPSYQIHQSR